MAKKRQFGNIRSLTSGRFQARFTGPDGTPVKAPRTFVSKKEANDWLSMEHARLLDGGWRDPHAGRLLLRDYATRWLELRFDLRPRPRQLYADQLRRFISDPPTWSGATTSYPGLGEHRLADITPGLVNRWFDWVSEVSKEAAVARSAPNPTGRVANRTMREWARGQGKQVAKTGRLPAGVRDAWQEAGYPGLAPGRLSEDPGGAQAAQVYRLLVAILNSAVRENVISSNPCQRRGAGQSRSSSTPPATVEELSRIAEAMQPRYQCAIWVTAFGALRAGEAFGLARKHVNIANRKITIERSVSHIPGKGQTFGPPKSEAGRRTIYLPLAVISLLEEHLNEWTDESPDALVFGTSRGTALTSANRTAYFRDAALAGGRPDLRFHDLRHTGAMLAAQHGATLPELMHRLGHSSVRASLGYLHHTDRADRDLAERLSGAFPALPH